MIFVIGGVIALGLLGFGGFLIYRGWSNNSDASTALNELYNKLKDIDTSPMQPGNDKVDNITVAKEQEKLVRAWVNESTTYFRPIHSIPSGEVNSKTYATALGATIYQLQQQAKDNNVTLPVTNYNFSFQKQSSELTISAGLAALAEQLGEVKAIVQVLFNARINDLENIQRVRLSDDDAGAQGADYIDDRPTTNDMAIMMPYVITFHSFTPELAKVISGFATSTNPFIIKYVMVQPLPASAGGMDNMNPGMPGGYSPGGMDPRYRVPGMFPPGGLPPGELPPGGVAGGTGAVPGKGGLPTAIKEQLLRVTLQVETVKLSPKS